MKCAWHDLIFNRMRTVVCVDVEFAGTLCMYK